MHNDRRRRIRRMDMSIQQLPENIIAKLKSSTTLICLNGVVCGLVKNSLDAGASKITISVDYSRGNCSVEDNGSGILPAEFGHSGGLGKLHCTSRFPTLPEIHGRSGAFLASLAALSLLSVTSHYHSHYSHNSIKIHNSEVLARHTPSPPDLRFLSFIHGTRVTVRDLFGSMPVRVKQRPALADKGTVSRDWEHLKHNIAALVLAWPGQVSVSLRDSIYQQSALVRVGEEPDVETSANQRRTELVSRVCKILCQASLSEESSPESWIHLKASTGSLSITGVVCLVPVATKRIQFISIGIHPVFNERGTNVLYEEINRAFANSSFGVEEQGNDVGEAEKMRQTKDRRCKTDGYTAKELQGKKGVDRWPMFYVRICLDEQGNRIHDIEELLDDRRQSLKTIVDILQTMLFEFLKKHHFRPKQFRIKRLESLKRSDSPDNTVESLSRSTTPAASWTSSRTSRSGMRFKSDSKSTMENLTTTNLRLSRSASSRPKSESPFDLWTMVKSGRPCLAFDNEAGPPQPKLVSAVEGSGSIGLSCHTESTALASLLDSSGNLLRAPFTDAESPSTLGDRSLDAAVAGQAMEGTHPRDSHETVWINPCTKQESIIDTRTGYIKNQLVESGVEFQVPGLTSSKRLRLQKTAPKKETGDWVRQLLSSWENPVFQPAEIPIPMAANEAELLNSVASGSGGYCHGSHLPSRIGASGDFRGVGGRVSKRSLRDAEIVAQVDRKFIFAKLPLGGTKRSSTIDDSAASLLVIIDQHAADERGRVEDLMRDYFQPCELEYPPKVRACTVLLDKPLQYEISAQEFAIFERYLSNFEHWGIVYQLAQAAASTTERRRSQHLEVLSLPSSISERCRLEPRLLIELLRKEAWKFDESDRGHATKSLHATSSSGQGQEHDLHWLSRFHGCPQGIIDMINSRACRSAIMFNDVLSVDECKKLLTRLAECAFPFQCAHGRPSVVPLVDLGDARINGSKKTDRKSFGATFKKWKLASERNNA